MFRHQLAVLPAMRGDSEALPFLGLTEAEAGAGGQGSQAATPAATLGNSYVDNLAKAGIKEVGTGVVGGWGLRVVRYELVVAV